MTDTKRRARLQAATGSVAGLLAGCLDGGSNAVVDHSFEVGGSEYGTGEHRTDVGRGEDSVDGTIRGRNGCYTAALDDVTYDDSADELTVAVHAYEDGDAEYCQECIVDVHYRATVDFEDGAPGTVRVLHDGERVATA